MEVRVERYCTPREVPATESTTWDFRACRRSCANLLIHNYLRSRMEAEARCLGRSGSGVQIAPPRPMDAQAVLVFECTVPSFPAEFPPLERSKAGLGGPRVDGRKLFTGRQIATRPYPGFGVASTVERPRGGDFRRRLRSALSAFRRTSGAGSFVSVMSAGIARVSPI